ncbi:AAA family ATPase [Oceanirhabdus sp. W0125-5]|uniref:AAA family ATPase n=1 Tax=Oceanirhabdus sp. W0125-5 TaxID=2999116 RepID=UPI0022F31200|nr:ATP-binding protein [Oceanirhabdus sp. W0125-5]WBW98090.1 ATP-binding protein [Oceanirhabdus sp. W0125-5]
MSKIFREYVNENSIEQNYEQNQYESYGDGKFKFKEHIKARYIEQSEPEYKGNMLIEALPPIYSMTQSVKIINELPYYSDSERLRDRNYRIHATLRLKNLLYVFSKHFLIEKRISLSIRNGYKEKNIIAPNFIKRTLKREDNQYNDFEQESKYKCIRSNCSSDVPGLTLVGISGGGKSIAINNILAMYPQCIVHNNYKGSSFLFKQLTYIKIDCTYDGSIKGLCISFFNEVDSVLGTNYVKKFGNPRNSIDRMINKMKKVVENHALGTLVIDEIQHLEQARNGAEKVLNFLTTLENELNLPIIYIGTYKACNKVLGRDFRQARRATGIGIIEWGIMKKDKEWKSFLKHMWKYQWTKEATELTDEIEEIIYKHSMGITERIVNLYIAVQIQAIISGKEQINAKVIEEIANRYMPLTKPMIDALRTGDYVELAKYEDIKALDVYKMYKNSKINQKEQEEIKNFMMSKEFEINLKREDLKMKIMQPIIEFEIMSKKEASKIVDLIIDEFGIEMGIEFLKKQVGKRIMESSNTDKYKQDEVCVKKTKREKYREPYEIYSEYEKNGIIKNPETDFE